VIWHFYFIFTINKREVVIDFAYLRGRQEEIIVKELSIAAEDVIQTFHFQSPYGMQPHGSEANGLNWMTDISLIIYYKRSLMKLWLATLISTVLGSKSLNSFKTRWVVLFITWKM
jgi:hypothetical protein